MKIIKRLLFLLIILPNISFSDVTNHVFFTQNTNSVDLSTYIEILPDPEASLTIEDIINREYNFQPVSVLGNNFGFSKAAYWVRFTIHTDASAPTPLLLEIQHPLLDNISLFIPEGNNRFAIKSSGEDYPFSQRDVAYRNYVFNLPINAAQENTYYLRLQTEGSMQLPLFLWTPNAFISHVDTSNLIMGGYYGIMSLLVLIAISSYVKIRDRLFLAYAFYLTSYLFFQLSLNGFGFQFLWYDTSYLASRATSASTGLVVIGGLVFSGSFLQVWGFKHRYLKTVYFILMTAAVTSVLLSLIGNYAIAVQFSTLVGMFFPFVVFIAAIVSVLNGYKPARFFLIAWSVFLGGVFIFGLLHLGLIPRTFFTTYAIQIGSLIEVLVIGYALMYRIDLLQAEKEQAVSQANVYLNQINTGLESLVETRTEQLEEKNKELSELAMHDSMTGLLNHNASLDYLERMKLYSQRYNKELAVIMADIDLFKAVNDTFGHVAGDKVITTIATVMQNTVRESDICGRFGGEEFILILPESDMHNTRELAERIRENIQALSIPEIDNMPVTASFGIAIYDGNNPSDNLLVRADSALYQAKKSGRNQVQSSLVNIVKD